MLDKKNLDIETWSRHLTKTSCCNWPIFKLLKQYINWISQFIFNEVSCLFLWEGGNPILIYITRESQEIYYSINNWSWPHSLSVVKLPNTVHIKLNWKWNHSIKKLQLPAIWQVLQQTLVEIDPILLKTTVQVW